jgi:PAS domain S-box-containing protein
MGIEKEPLEAKSPADTDEVLREWRSRAVRFVLIVIAASGLLSWGSVFHNDLTANGLTPITWAYVAFYLAFVLLAVLPRIDYHLRAWGLVGLSYMNAVASFARLGLVGSGRLYLLTAPIFATLLLGGRAGILATALSLAMYFTIAPLASFNQFGEWHRLLENPYQLDRWGESGMALVTFLFAVMAMIISFQRLMRRTLAARQETSRTLEQTARSLLEREERLALVMQATNDGLFDWDILSGQVYYSPRWKSMLGYADHEVEGNLDGWQRLLHPDDRTRALAAVQDHLEGRTPYLELEHRLKHKDGEYRWILARGLALCEGSGRAYRFAGSHTDITARKRAEEQIQRQNELLAALHETALGVIRQLELQSLLETIVERAVRLLGADSGFIFLVTPEKDAIETMVGIGVERNHVGVQLKPWEGLAGTVWQTGEPLMVETYQDWPQRSKIYAGDAIGPTMGAPLKSAAEVAGVLGVSRPAGDPTFQPDEVEILNRFAQLASIALENARLHTSQQEELAERKRAEEAVRASDVEMRALLAAMTDVILVLDADGRYVKIAPTNPTLLYRPASEMVGKTLQEVFPPAQAETFTSNIHQALSTQQPVNFEYQLLIGEQEIWFDATVSPMSDHSVIWVGRDISQRKQAQQSLQQRLDFEHLITDISTEFINLGPTEIDAGIQHALEVIGQFAGADRSYVFQFSEDQACMDNTHEWCTSEVEPQAQRMQGQDTGVTPWTIERIKRLEMVKVPRVASLPGEARMDQLEFQAQSIQSLICIPMVYRGEAIGFIGFDAVQRERDWSEDDAALLRVVGEIIVNSLEHKRAQAIEEGQRKFLELLATGGAFSDILHALVRLIEEQWPGMLGLILLLDEDGQHLHIGASASLPEEYVDSIEGLEIGPQVGSCGTACYTKQRVIVEDIATDPRWEGLRSLGLEYGLRACWSEPVFSESGQVVGTFAMYYRQPRTPSKAELHTIETAAHMVGVAVEHERAQQALQQTELRFRGVFEGAPIGVSITSLEGKLVETNRALQQMFGYSEEELRNLSVWEYTYPEDFDADNRLFQQLVPGKIDHYQLEKRYIRKNGEVFWGRLSLSLARGPQGEPLFAIATTEDINEAKEAAEQLAQAYLSLEQRVGERTRELAAVNAIAAVVSGSLDLNAILSAALAKTLEVTGMELGIAYRLEAPEPGMPGSERLIPLTHLGFSDRFFPISTPLNLKASNVERAAATGSPVVWEPQAYPNPVTRRAIEAEGVRSGVSIPLLAKDRLVGALIIGSRQAQTVTHEELSMLSAIGQQVALAVENARLHQAERDRHAEAERRRQVAEGLREILTILNSKRSLDETLNFIVEQARRLLGSDAVAIYRLQERDGPLAIQSSFGLDPEFVDLMRVTLVRGAAELAVSERRPVAIPDLHERMDLFIQGNKLSPLPIQAFFEQLVQRYLALLAVPLIIKEDVYGAIAFYYRKQRQFSSEDITLVETFAHQTALAIETARLYDQAQQTALLEERSRLARELHDSVTQSLYSVTLYAEAAARLFDAGDTQTAAEHLRELRDTSKEALREMRLLIYELRPPVLGTGGLAGALQARLDAVEARAGLRTELKVEGTDRLPYAVQEELYHIAREALNNQLKHARARSVTIRLSFQDTLTLLEICDDGVGFYPDETRSGGGLGIFGMKERAQHIGAQLEILSSPGKGTTVRVLVSPIKI